MKDSRSTTRPTGSLPFNPMVPPIDPQSGRAIPISHVHELGNMLQRIYKLGDQQAFQLREAMEVNMREVLLPRLWL